MKFLKAVFDLILIVLLSFTATLAGIVLFESISNNCPNYFIEWRGHE